MLLLILAFLICFVYLKHYFKSNSSFEIIQTPISKLTPSLLFEKSPIVISEPIVQPIHLTKSIFKYMYICKKEKNITIDKLYTCNGKYCILYPTEDDAHIHINHPNHKEEKFQSVKLYKNQCIVLPMFWKFKTHDPNIHSIDLFDIFTFYKN